MEFYRDVPEFLERLPSRDTDYTSFRPQPSDQPRTDGVVQPYADSPLDEEPVAKWSYPNLISQAQDYVYFYTPYLAVGEELLEAMKAAAKRGVDVRVMVPGIPDKKLVYRLTRSYYVPLLRAGVRIYEYTPGFLHAKCCVSDDRAAVVGSINLDYRSLFLHFECGVLLLGGSQVRELREETPRMVFSPAIVCSWEYRRHQRAGHPAGQCVAGCSAH